jgi:TonB family protein
MFLEMLQIVFWFNPAIYFYKKSIAIIHEFLADEASTQITSNKAEYATLLISKQFNIEPATVFTQHFFNHSTLKSRIIMLSKNPSKKTALLKYVLLAPLFFVMLVASSFTVDKNTNLQTVLDKMENNISQNTITKSNFLSPIVKIEHVGNIIEYKTTEKQENNTITSLNFLPNGEDIQVDNFHFPNSQKDTFPQGKNPKTIFTVAEQNPEFVGGTKELYRWLGSKIKYPKGAQRANVSGRVFVKFIVEADGSINDVKIMKGIGFGCDEEAVRVVQNMPKWNPGIQNGRPIAVYYNMPIVFKLDEPKGGKKGIEDNEEIGVTDFNNGKESKIVGTFPIGVKREMPVEIKVNGAFENALIFVNDIEILDKKMNDINPSSIESVSVLKNHEAIKAYGPRAKDGVILIKTKTNFIKTDDKK